MLKSFRIAHSFMLFALGFFGALLFAFYSPANAQQPGKIFRIGFLDPSNASGMAVMVDAFRQELSKLGWVEGKNIAFEHRFAEGKLSAYPSLRRTWFVFRLI